MLGTQPERGKIELARLNLVFTPSGSNTRDITYERSLGTSHHMVPSSEYVVELTVESEAAWERGEKSNFKMI